MVASLPVASPLPLTLARVFLSWTVDPAALVAVAALGAGYVLALRRVRRGGTPWPNGRVVAFLCGLAVILVVKTSFLEVYSSTLFWVRATQNIALLMIAPMLLAMGAPLSLTLGAVSAPTGARLRRIGRSRAARSLTFPLLLTLALTGPLFVLYLTPLYGLSLRLQVVADLTQLALVCCGFVYYWTRLQVDPTPRADHHLVSVWISMAEVVLDGALGLFVWLGPLLAPEHYLALHRAWWPDLRADQVIGAGVLWIGGDVAGLPFLGALVLRWRRDDLRQAEVVDAELDERERVEEPHDEGKLWWEDHPVLAERFKRR